MEYGFISTTKGQHIKLFSKFIWALIQLEDSSKTHSKVKWIIHTSLHTHNCYYN